MFNKSKCIKIIINSKGNRRAVRVIETPLHASGDAALGGFAIDETELDFARNELSQHIEANQRTLDQIKTSVAIFGPSQNLIYHNRAFQELWELDDADVGAGVSSGVVLRGRRAGAVSCGSVRRRGRSAGLTRRQSTVQDRAD